MPVPTEPKIYHIVHVDRLASIVSDGHLWSDAEMARRRDTGTTIGISTIKDRRLTNSLTSHRDMHVGDCVPFYFCPRSVMLYVISMRNHPELKYRDGQEPIVHLEADLRESVDWANDSRQRWAFTTSNAGSYYFEDHSNLDRLDKINWDAVNARKWSGTGVDPSVKEDKQAEFLVEDSFPWELISRIGIGSQRIYATVQNALQGAHHRPAVEVKRDWYYRSWRGGTPT